MNQIPVFVYGSLRKGLYNYERTLKNKITKIAPATLEGYDMYSLIYYPGIIKGTGKVVGEVMYIKKELYDNVLQKLDFLEGYNRRDPENSFYVRKLLKVQLQNGELIDAYVYIFNNENALKGRQKVVNGDWKEYLKKNKIKASY